MNHSLDDCVVVEGSGNVCRALHVGLVEGDAARGSFMENSDAVEDVGCIFQGGGDLGRIGDVASELGDGGDGRGE